MQNESYNDHCREEEVEEKRNRKVWRAEVDQSFQVGDGVRRSSGLVHEQDTRRCINSVSRGSIALELWSQMPTQRGEVHQGWEGDGPAVPGVNNVTTIELEGWQTLARLAAELDTPYPKAVS